MTDTKIHEIKKIYKRRRLALNVILFFMLLFFLSFTLLLIVDDPQIAVYLSGAFFMNMLLIILTLFFTPTELDSYLLIRLHMSELILSIRQNNSDKALKHINLLSKNIELLNDEIDTITVFNESQKLFHNLVLLLKYRIYPDLLDNKPQNIDLSLLANVEKGINSNHFDKLKSLIDVDSLESISKELLFPYEKPSLIRGLVQKINAIIQKDTTNNLTKNKYLKFFGSFCFFIFIVPFFVELDSSLMVTIIGASIVFAKGF
jgi:hypothetical protein